jgi:hypothetical protein
MIPNGVFSKEWTELTSQISPHRVYQPNPFQQRERTDKNKENDVLE